jgi:TolB-like protein
MKPSVLLRHLFSLLLAFNLLFIPETTGQESTYPVAVSVSFADGGVLPELEDRLVGIVSELNYMVRSDAFIIVEGILFAGDKRDIGGMVPKSTVKLDLNIQIKDLEQGDVLQTITATTSGLGETWEQAVESGARRIKIDKTKLSKALESCYDDYLRIGERRRQLSKERFEYGERLFKEKRYREAIKSLKGVYPETEFFPRAQQLIQDIRLIMPKPVIAVLKFKTNSSQVADNFRDILTTALMLIEEDIKVLEREQISEILSEQRMELDGLVDPATACEYGRLIGAGFMFLGRLTVSGSEVDISARLVKVETGEIIMAFQKKDFSDRLEIIAGSIVDEIHQAIEDGKLDEVVIEDRVVVDTKTPRLMIMIPEVHIHRPIPDPAGETEMIRKFVASGFRVVDQAQINKIRDTREAKAAAKGDLQSAMAIARQYGAEVIIVGEAFSENVPRPGDQLQTCGGRVEARAINTDTGMILAANGKEAHATDRTELVAAKRALRTAGGLLADDMIKQIIGFWERQGTTREIELFVRNIEYDQLAILQNFLKDQKGITDVQRRSFDEGVAIIDVESENNIQKLADILAIAKFEDFSIKIETLGANTIELYCR